MATAFVKQLDQQSGTGNLTLTIPVGGVPIGHTIIVGLNTYDTSISITDTGGNTYQQDEQSAAGHDAIASIYSAPVTTALLHGDIISISLTSAHPQTAVAIEISGAKQTSYVGQVAGNNTNSSSPTVGPTGSVPTGDFVFAVFSASYSSGAPFTFTPNTGYVAGGEAAQGGVAQVDALYRVAATPGTVTPGGSSAGSSVQAAQAVATYEHLSVNPTLTSFTPTTGPVGTVVTIMGSGFTGATAVTFDGTDAASFVVNSDTQIVATVDTGTATGVIAVTTPDGTGDSSGLTPADFTVGDWAPIYTATIAQPTYGFPSWGVPVGHTLVLVVTDDARATPVPSASDSQGNVYTVDASWVMPGSGPDFVPRVTIISARISSALVQSVDHITFTSSFGDALLTDWGAFFSPDVSAHNGPMSPGTSVSTGTTGATSYIAELAFAAFAGYLSSGFQTITPGSGYTALNYNGGMGGTAEYKSLPTTGTQSASGTLGTSAFNPAGALVCYRPIAVLGVPTITSFTPSSAKFNDTVTINGSGFTNATSINFGTTPAVSFVVVSDSQITAVAPDIALPSLIHVTTPIGSVATGSNYTPLAPDAPVAAPLLSIPLSATVPTLSNGAATYTLRCSQYHGGGIDNSTGWLATQTATLTQVNSFDTPTIAQWVAVNAAGSTVGPTINFTLNIFSLINTVGGYSSSVGGAAGALPTGVPPNTLSSLTVTSNSIAATVPGSLPTGATAQYLTSVTGLAQYLPALGAQLASGVSAIINGQGATILPETVYPVWWAAQNAHGSIFCASPTSVTAGPKTPVITSATQSTNSVALTMAPGGATPDSYNVYRRDHGTSSWGSALANPSTGTYVDSTALNGHVYDYAVTAIIGGIESAYSSPVTVTMLPGVPTAPVAVTVTSSAVTTDNAPALTSGATSQTVGIRITGSGSPYTEYPATAGSPNTISGLPENTGFDLVRIDRNGAGAAVSTVTNFSTGTAVAAPGTPYYVTFGTVTPTSIQCFLPAYPSNTSSLTLQRSADPSFGSSTNVATGLTSGAVVVDDNGGSGLTPGTTYYYRAVAVGSGGSTNGLVSERNTSTAPVVPGMPGLIDIIGDAMEDVSVGVDPGALPSNTTTITIRLSATGPTSGFSDWVTGILGAGLVTLGSVTADTPYWIYSRAIGPTGLTTDGPIAKFTTLSLPATASAPSQPAPPTLASSTPSSATINQPAWPTGTSTMLLYNGDPSTTGVLVHTFTTSGEGPYTDTTVRTPNSYNYYCIAHNSTGNSPQSTALTVSLVGSATVSWVNPVNDATIHGNVPLVLNAAFASGADPAIPLRVVYNGVAVPNFPTSPLTGTLASGQWRGYFDTRAFAYNGTVVLTAYARDAAGFDSAPVAITCTLNNSLEGAVEWEDYLLPTLRVNELIADNLNVAQVMLGPQSMVIQNNPGNPAQYYQFYLLSPEGSNPSDYTDIDAMLANTQTMQGPLSLGTPVTLIGNPDQTLRLRVKLTPAVPAPALWDTGDPTPVKIRGNSDGSLEIVTNGHLFRFDGTNGLTSLCKFSDFGVTGVTDATGIGVGSAGKQGKVYAISSGTLAVIDLITGNVSYYETLIGEAKTLLSVERMSDSQAYILFSSGGNATLYQHQVGIIPAALWSLEKTVSFAEAFSGNLYFTTTDYGIYVSMAGAAPTLIYQHNVQVTGLLLVTSGTTTGVLQFLDANGNIYQAAGNNTANLVGAITSAISIGQWQGQQSALVGTATQGKLVYQQQSGSGLYAPILQLSSAINLTQQARLLTTLVAAVGDPLNGGTPAIIDESLIVMFTTSSTVNVARIQATTLSGQNAYLGTACRPIFYPFGPEPE